MKQVEPGELGPVRAAIAWLGAKFIYLRTHPPGRGTSESEVPWLDGPRGSGYLGDRPCEELAAREGLVLERNAATGGLVRVPALFSGRIPVIPLCCQGSRFTMSCGCWWRRDRRPRGAEGWDRVSDGVSR